jgi:hypothetical protein
MQLFTRLEYGPKSGAISVTLFHSQFLTKFPAAFILIAVFYIPSVHIACFIRKNNEVEESLTCI